MLRSLVLILAVFCATITATDVKRCKKNEPFPLKVDIMDCETPPCSVYKGLTAVMEVQFVGNRNDITKITAEVHAKALGISLPYILDEKVADVCSNLMYDATCPIYDSEDVTYKFNMYVDPLYPEISVDVEVKLVDEFNEVLSCFAVSVKVRKPL